MRAARAGKRSPALKGCLISFSVESVPYFAANGPSRDSRDDLDGGAIDEWLVLRRQGHRVSFRKAGGNLDPGQILQGKLNRLALQVALGDTEDVRLALIDAQPVAR